MKRPSIFTDRDSASYLDAVTGVGLILLAIAILILTFKILLT